MTTFALSDVQIVLIGLLTLALLSGTWLLSRACHERLKNTPLTDGDITAYVFGTAGVLSAFVLALVQAFTA